MPTKKKSSSKNHERGIYLGYPFDQLFNHEHPLDGIDSPGILLPDDGGNVGSGNIVICGPPGSAKSTLALQFAVACVKLERNTTKAMDKNNNLEKSIHGVKVEIPISGPFNAAYISLEEDCDHVLAKAEMFGWKKYFRPLRHLHATDDISSPESLADTLTAILTQPLPASKDNKICRYFVEGPDDRLEKCKARHRNIITHAEPRILLPSFSPRRISAESADANELFLERYSQIERLLVAAKEIERRNKEVSSPEIIPPLRMVCIDSLNMLGSRPLTREEMYRLFDLFKRHYVIGVFTVENTQNTPFDSTMADIVVQLHVDEDRSYFVRYMEVEKSRYRSQVNGRHYFKTVSRIDETEAETKTVDPRYDCLKTGVVVYPSLHHVVARRSEKKAKSPKQALNAGCKDDRFDFGVAGMERIIPQNLRPCDVVMLEGPLGTFKSTLAMNFLAAGLKKGENALLIRLSDATEETTNFRTETKLDQSGFDSRQLKFMDDDKDVVKLLRKLGPRTKTRLRLAEYITETGISKMVEVNFTSSAIFPEEFVQIVGDIFALTKSWKNSHKESEADNKTPSGGEHLERGRNGIHRVVLDDTSKIGVGYPFLYESHLIGKMFLPALVHILRTYGVDIVLTGTTGELAMANEVVYQASALADTVVSSRALDVYGDRYIVVRGDALRAGYEDNESRLTESEPAVIRLYKNKNEEPLIELDLDYLKGLVGFETGNIHRAGLSVFLFQENDRIHGTYNRDIEIFLRSAFAFPAFSQGPTAANNHAHAQVSITPFDSQQSEAIHDSLLLLEEGPFDSTVLFTVDEFFRPPSGESRRDTLCRIGYPDGNFEALSVEDYLPEVVLTEYTRPYYNNVLLIAYRTDILGKSFCEGIEDSVKSWFSLWNKVSHLDLDQISSNFTRTQYKEEKDDGKTNKGRGNEVISAFWCDLSAEETLACSLMDAIISESEDKNIHKNNTKYIKVLRKAYKELLKIHSMKKIVEEIAGKRNRWPLSKEEIQETTNTILEAASTYTRSRLRHKSETTWRVAAGIITSPGETPLTGKCMQEAKNRVLNMNPLHVWMAAAESMTGRDSRWCEEWLVNWGRQKVLPWIRFKIINNKRDGVLTKIAKERGTRILRILLEVNANTAIENRKKRKADAPKTEIEALAHLMHLARFDKNNSPLPIPKLEKGELPDDAAVYLCWYSQLRELIDRNPSMAKHLNVCALPGGGFRGDWYLGVARGSVSLSLGKKVVRMLTTPKEEYKRFARGVGLPTLHRFDPNAEGSQSKKNPLPDPQHFPWLRGTDLKLSSIMAIHRRAHSRSNIPGYEHFRSALACLAKQIGPFCGEPPPDSKEILEIVSRLPGQIRTLANLPAGKSEDDRQSP